VATLQDAIDWIACNDNAGSDDGPREIEGYVSTALVADVWKRRPQDIAVRVHEVRRAWVRATESDTQPALCSQLEDSHDR